MRVVVLEEHGYIPAIYGLGKSHGVTTDLPYSSFKAGLGKGMAARDRMEKVALRLNPLDKGHNKYLESIQVWVEVDAPRYWWQEMDTYRVGTTKQSESTMHTMMKRPLTQEDFEEGISEALLNFLNYHIENKDFRTVKRHLPEGFLQARIINFNYKVLRHIFVQRWNHRLPEWQFFCRAILDQVEHPELLPQGE